MTSLNGNRTSSAYTNGYHDNEEEIRTNGVDTLTATHDDEEEEVQEEEMTPAELIIKLQQCWLNEKWSPELLEQKTEIIEYVIEQITFMEGNIKAAKKGDFRIAVHKLELDRIKFMLHSYLRIRIKKIEQFASAILEEDEKRRLAKQSSKLSPEEFAYAVDYLKNVRTHLRLSVLDRLPPNLRELNESTTMPKPDLDRFVFLKALDDIRGILVDEDLSSDGRSEILDMDKDDLFIMRYKPIRNNLYVDQIQLI